VYTIVATFVNGNEEAGCLEVLLDSANVVSGVYLCTLRAGGYRKSLKVLHLK